MSRSFSLAIALIAGALAAASCYSERPAPPSFRYKCDSEADCRDNEACIDKLCQVECTQATSRKVCTGSDHLLCFNGVCTSGCQVENNHCPSSQDCIDLEPFGIEFDSGSGFITSGTPPTGICGELCDDADPESCPQGETCLQGFCVASCVDSTTCQQPFTCQLGFCLPDFGETSGAATFPGTFTDTGMGSDESSTAGGSSSTAGESSGPGESSGIATTGGAQ